MSRITFSILLLIFSVNLFSQTLSPIDYSLKAPTDTAQLKKINLWATQYYIHEFNSSGKISLLDQNEQPLGLYADTCDFCTARLEGTAYIKDSTGKITVLNFAKTGTRSLVDCRKCKRFLNSRLDVDSWGKTLWTISSGFGNGVKNYKLIPYRTIAVDCKIIPYGTLLFIPEAKGKIILLPDGTHAIHDGYFFAGDTGSAITKNHIDIFTGINSSNPFPEVIKSNEHKTFKAFVVTNQEIIQKLTFLQTK